MNIKGKMNFKLNKGFKQFLVKTMLFVVLFIIISLIIGQKIVGSSLLYGFNIYIYGGMGYILLFSISGFILLYRKQIYNFKSYGYKLKNIIFLLICFILVAGFYILELNIKKVEITLINTILIHILFLLMFVFLILGIYGLDFVRNFIKKFKKELLYFLIFGIVVYSLMSYVWKLWPYLSLIVLKIVSFLSKLISQNVQVIAPRTLIVEGFAAEIAEACSGVYSIFIFTALYLFIVLLDWRKINKKKAFLLFIPAILGAFFVNVFRVFLIFIVGAYISHTAALGLYHSYTGMIFFIIYFAIFWLLFYKWMKDEKSKFIPKDTLYRNSIYLMLSTFIMAIFGFLFWMINARLFTTEQVGLATTIISVASLITTISLLGLNTAIIRYLPKSERKNDKINTCFTLVSLIAIIITTIFLISLNKFSPKLLFIKENLFFGLIFIVFMIFASFSSLIESIFIAYRASKFVLMKNSIFSVFKIFLPFVFVSLGAYGIFSSWMIALILGVCFSFIILIFKFNYKPKIVFYDSIVRKIGKYSFGNYIAGFLGSLPILLLPLMITNLLKPETTAYYYMSMMIASLLFVIPHATSNSLFAEGSYNERKMKLHVKKAVKIISLLLIPAILITIFFGKYVLLLIGKEYSLEGFRFLQLLALSGIFVSVNSVIMSILKIRKKISALIYRSLISAIIILGLSYLFIQQGFNLLGIGYSWIIGQVVTSLIFVIYLLKN